MDVNELLGKVADHLSVSRAFGPAYEKDDTLIIPVALVAGGGGGGGSEMSSGDAPLTKPDAHGSGSGFGGVVLPVGAYIVKGERVRWMPAINVTVIALSALGIVRVLARAHAHTRRSATR
jgi:uncharacterized spore protein YtfJ